MLCVGYLMVTIVHSDNLSSFHYFLDKSNGVHLLSDTNQRGQCDNLVMFRPFLHSLLLHPHPQRRLRINGFSFQNTLHRPNKFVVLPINVQQSTWSDSIGYLTHSLVCHRLGSLLDIHSWCMMRHLLYQIHLYCSFTQQLCQDHLHLQLPMQTFLDMQWYNIFSIHNISDFLCHGSNNYF